VCRGEHPDLRGPGSDAALSSHDVRTAARSELSEAAKLEEVKVWPAYTAWAGVKMGPVRKRPVTDGAVLHNETGGRASAAIWDLRLVDCRAAGRASR
jgi:hypothetical protein